MAGKIKEMIDAIILERSNGNPSITEMTKAKFILKGINPNNFNDLSPDDPEIMAKILNIAEQLNVKYAEYNSANIKSVYTTKTMEEEAVAEIKNQLEGSSIKLLVFFGSSYFDHIKLSRLMQEAFADSIVFGCSTAGEIVSGKLLENSLVVMAFHSNIVADIKVEVVEELSENLNIEKAFASFEGYFNKSSYNMEANKYLGIVLIDGLSMKEEEFMDQIGNRTNVYFVGGSAGDDRKFVKTFVCANGQAYSDAAVLALLKMNNEAEFGIIKTQSFKVLKEKLIATKVNAKTREVIEFNHRPAIAAYMDAVGAVSVKKTHDYFMTHPVGLVINEDIFVRSPRQQKGTNIQFYCNLLENMDVNLLESTNIVDDTKDALEKKIREFGKIEGIINFNCIQRTLELQKKDLTREYGAIFSEIPTIGFSTYGEEYIGHMTQTATMLVFKTRTHQPNNFQEGRVRIEEDLKVKSIEQKNEELSQKVSELQQEVLRLNLQLDETTVALKHFNIMLEDEINERTKREAEISYLSYHDKLTGLYNRRFYEAELERLDTERNLPISIIMGDLNDLKLINDVYGHDKGDELLQKAATGIQGGCRKDDIIARWGGDEFVILLPKTNTEVAREIVERIKGQYAKEDNSPLNVSISFGWDTKKNTDENIREILKKAEKYMYKHKLREKRAQDEYGS